MLQELVERMGITGFAQIALVLFVSVFVSVLVREKYRSDDEVNHLSDMPLSEEGETAAPKGAHQ